jgi:hypothetical protein
MFKITTGNGRGTCINCSKPINKGEKQIAVDFGSGSFHQARRAHLACVVKTETLANPEPKTIQVLQTRTTGKDSKVLKEVMYQMPPSYKHLKELVVAKVEEELAADRSENSDPLEKPELDDVLEIVLERIKDDVTHYFTK